MSVTGPVQSRYREAVQYFYQMKLSISVHVIVRC